MALFGPNHKIVSLTSFILLLKLQIRGKLEKSLQFYKVSKQSFSLLFCRVKDGASEEPVSITFVYQTL